MGRIPQGNLVGTQNSVGFRCPNSAVSIPQKPQPEGDGDEEEYGFTWKMVVMGYGCGTLLGCVLGYRMLSTGRPKWFNAIADATEYVILTIQNKRR
ncbi:hypothetical protein HanPI659440_Chr14g0571451 [Helianthus annuus]|nr:hypothetical protein HanPI659440_Chr14g0571451 [Helianthus annuus]